MSCYSPPLNYYTLLIPLLCVCVFILKLKLTSITSKIHHEQCDGEASGLQWMDL